MDRARLGAARTARLLLYAIVLPAFAVAPLGLDKPYRPARIAAVALLALAVAALCVPRARARLVRAWDHHALLRGADTLLWNGLLALASAECVLAVAASVSSHPLLASPSARSSSHVAEIRSRLRAWNAESDALHPGVFNDTDWQMPKPPGLVRIAALGDSFAYGIVGYERNFLTLLEPLLGERVGRRVEVANLGLPELHPSDYLYLLEQEGLALEPDAVLVLLYAGNDFHLAKPRSWLDLRRYRVFEFTRRAALLSAELVRRAREDGAGPGQSSAASRGRAARDRRERPAGHVGRRLSANPDRLCRAAATRRRDRREDARAHRVDARGARPDRGARRAASGRDRRAAERAPGGSRPPGDRVGGDRPRARLARPGSPVPPRRRSLRRARRARDRSPAGDRGRPSRGARLPPARHALECARQRGRGRALAPWRMRAPGSRVPLLRLCWPRAHRPVREEQGPHPDHALDRARARARGAHAVRDPRGEAAPVGGALARPALDARERAALRARLRVHPRAGRLEARVRGSRGPRSDRDVHARLLAVADRARAARPRRARRSALHGARAVRWPSSSAPA